ncbi:MAG: nitroreductase family protein [Candidatus Bathyarchaeota archaeon]|jgi:nitroreductase
MIYEKIIRRRSIRRYIRKDVPKKILLECVDAARLSPSGANRQPLKYIVINEQELSEKVFTTLSWAGYLPDFKPNEEEMPSAYIVILLDKKIRETPGHDAGIAAMSISMVAYDEGLGTCILGAINRGELKRILDVPDNLDIVLIVALGYSAENPVIEEVKSGKIKYWLDLEGVLHVPKRSLEDIVEWNINQK